MSARASARIPFIGMRATVQLYVRAQPIHTCSCLGQPPPFRYQVCVCFFPLLLLACTTVVTQISAREHASTRPNSSSTHIAAREPPHLRTVLRVVYRSPERATYHGTKSTTTTTTTTTRNGFLIHFFACWFVCGLR